MKRVQHVPGTVVQQVVVDIRCSGTARRWTTSAGVVQPEALKGRIRGRWDDHTDGSVVQFSGVGTASAFTEQVSSYDRTDRWDVAAVVLQ